MKKILNQIILLLVIIFLIHSLYVVWINPNVEIIKQFSLENGTSLPRNFFIIFKDIEQEICMILFFWGFYLIAEKFYETSAQSYLFDVDLLEDVSSDSNDAENILKNLEELPKEINDSPLIKIISSALRRFLITGSVQNASESITPALDALIVKNEAELALVKYIAWAIPSIGFLGTVRGIGMAMTQAEIAVSGDIGPMTESLGMAFNSTFVALLASIIIMLMLSFLGRAQDEQLVRVQEYCEKYLIKRISIIKKPE